MIGSAEQEVLARRCASAHRDISATAVKSGDGLALKEALEFINSLQKRFEEKP